MQPCFFGGDRGQLRDRPPLGIQHLMRLMTHPLGYYVDPSPVLDALAEKYGYQLEKMSIAEKFQTISILSLTLFHYANSPVLSIKIIWNPLTGPNDSLRESLGSLDGCTPKTLLGLMEALVAQLRHQQLSEVNAAALTVMRAIRQDLTIE